MAKENKRKSPVRDVVLENLKGFVRKGSEAPDDEFISTGYLPLDLAIAHGINPDKADLTDVDIESPGGFPLGKLVEVYGTEGSGKSTLAYRVCGFAQKLGYNCLWIDAENSFSRDLATINGADLSKLHLSTLYDENDPDKMFYAEDIMENICVASKSGFQVVVLDSIAALTTKAQMENEIGQGGVGMGALALLMSLSVKKICNYAAKFNTLVIMINQVREKIVSWGNPETTPGGRAVRFHASIRIRIEKQTAKEGSIYVENDNGEKTLIAGKSYFQIKKNRFGKPVRDDEGKDVSLLLPIYYENYFPDIEEVLFEQGRFLNSEPGTKMKIIKVRNNLYSWGDIKATEVGKTGFIKALKEANAVEALVEAIKNAAKEEGILLPPEILKYQPETVKKKKLLAKIDNVAQTAEDTLSAIAEKSDGKETKVHRGRKAKDSGNGDPVAVET